MPTSLRIILAFIFKYFYEPIGAAADHQHIDQVWFRLLVWVHHHGLAHHIAVVELLETLLLLVELILHLLLRQLRVRFQNRFRRENGRWNWGRFVKCREVFKLIRLVLALLLIRIHYLSWDYLHRGLLLTQLDDVWFYLTPKVHIAILGATNHMLVVWR